MDVNSGAKVIVSHCDLDMNNDMTMTIHGCPDLIYLYIIFYKSVTYIVYSQYSLGINEEYIWRG